jgi:methionine synthase II (cobalamin-independent)
VEIISFDAYNYLETISLYPEKLKEFLSQGRYLAWGIVPASSRAMGEEIESLIKRFEDGLKLLVSKGISRETILENLLITPSCGTGTLPVEVAEKVVKLTRGVSDGIRDRYFRG